MIADANGKAHAVDYLDRRPGAMFLLDHHADGGLTEAKGEVMFPGAI